jgi:hypothetical protein
MTYRWAVVVMLAMLSPSALPATAWCQTLRAGLPADVSPNADENSEPDGDSPVIRFAAAADQAQVAVPDPKRRAVKRSVLEPSTSRWLEDSGVAPLDDSLPDDLGPPDLLSPTPAHSDLSPEIMPDDLTLLRGDPDMMRAPSALPAAPLGPAFELPARVPAHKQPMLRESWMFRPFNISIFEGALFATPPITPQFNTAVSYFTGFRVGWDFNTHFGGETRFGFSKVFLLDAGRNTQVGYQRIFYFDSNLLIYPWGDTRVRPFLSIGGGLADIMIVGNAGGVLHPGAFNLPFGGGIKYRLGSRVAFRADIRDNLTFSGSGGLRTLNNIEVVGGIEFHFGGGERRSYWPWNPSRHWW